MRILGECGLPLGSPNRPRRRRRCPRGLGLVWQRIREGSKRRKIRSCRRETIEDGSRTKDDDDDEDEEDWGIRGIKMRDCLDRSDRSSGSAWLRHAQVFLSRGEDDEPEFNAINIEFFVVKKGVHRNEKTYYEIVCQMRILGECGLPLGSPNRPPHEHLEDLAGSEEVVKLGF
jgi:hypothetical protein